MSLFGLLNLNKPSGVTSRRVVDRVQRLVKPAKVGHAGTLDPLASGVLVIGIGQATRLVEYVQRLPKHYHGEFLLGCTSTTEDVEGDVTQLPGAVPPSRAAIDAAASALTGEIQQRPPAFSALKVDGRRAYAKARAGESFDLAPRAVQVYRLSVIEYEYPRLCLEIECGGGTYVRSLGRDLAELAGTGAVMSALTRTAIGRFTIDRALDPELLRPDNLEQALLPPQWAVQDLMPLQTVTPEEVARLANGLAIECPAQAADTCAAVDAVGRVVAILERREAASFRPAKYFPAD